MMRREDTWGVVFSKLLTVENLSVQKKQQKCVKRIPPNAAIPLANPILRTSLLCPIGDYPPDYLILNRQLVCIRNSIQELFKNCFFLAVGTILVLVAACFYSKLYWKSIQKLFQLLARSWFWRQFFSAKKLQKNTKRIPSPNAAIPLVNPILRTSLLYQIWACPSDSDETGWKKRHDVLCFRDFWHL